MLAVQSFGVHPYPAVGKQVVSPTLWAEERLSHCHL